MGDDLQAFIAAEKEKLFRDRQELSFERFKLDREKQEIDRKRKLSAATQTGGTENVGEPAPIAANRKMAAVKPTQRLSDEDASYGLPLGENEAKRQELRAQRHKEYIAYLAEQERKGKKKEPSLGDTEDGLLLKDRLSAKERLKKEKSDEYQRFLESKADSDGRRRQVKSPEDGWIFRNADTAKKRLMDERHAEYQAFLEQQKNKPRRRIHSPSGGLPLRDHDSAKLRLREERHAAYLDWLKEQQSTTDRQQSGVYPGLSFTDDTRKDFLRQERQADYEAFLRARHGQDEQPGELGTGSHLSRPPRRQKSVSDVARARSLLADERNRELRFHCQHLTGEENAYLDSLRHGEAPEFLLPRPLSPDLHRATSYYDDMLARHRAEEARYRDPYQSTMRSESNLDSWTGGSRRQPSPLLAEDLRQRRVRFRERNPAHDESPTQSQSRSKSAPTIGPLPGWSGDQDRDQWRSKKRYAAELDEQRKEKERLLGQRSQQLDQGVSLHPTHDPPVPILKMPANPSQSSYSGFLPSQHHTTGWPLPQPGLYPTPDFTAMLAPPTYGYPTGMPPNSHGYYDNIGSSINMPVHQPPSNLGLPLQPFADGARRGQSVHVNAETSVGGRTSQAGGQVDKKTMYRMELEKQMKDKMLAQEKAKREREEYEQKKNAEIAMYNPFGRAGGGAPNRDEKGRLVADLRQMRTDNDKATNEGRASRAAGTHRSTMPPERWGDQGVSVSPEHDQRLGGYEPFTSVGIPTFEKDHLMQSSGSSQNQVAGGGGGGGGDGGGGKTTKEEYRDYLQQQIDEKKAKQQREDNLKKLEEEKELRRLEADRQRMKEEYERELEEQKRKKEEAKRQNEELRLAREAQKEKELKRQESASKPAQERKHKQTTSSDDQGPPFHYQPPPVVRNNSPPVPAVLARLGQDPAAQAPEAPDHGQAPLQDNRHQASSPPVPALQAKLQSQRPPSASNQMRKPPSPSPRRSLADSGAESRQMLPSQNGDVSAITRQLAEMREKLEEEQRRLTERISTSDEQYVTLREASPIQHRQHSGRLRRRAPEDIFTAARVKKKPLVVGVRDPTSSQLLSNPPLVQASRDQLQDPSFASTVAEFTSLKYDGASTARKQMWNSYPNAPHSADGVDRQQRALLRRQDEELEVLTAKLGGAPQPLLSQESGDAQVILSTKAPSTSLLDRPLRAREFDGLSLSGDSEFLPMDSTGIESAASPPDTQGRQASARQRRRQRIRHEQGLPQRPSSSSGLSLASFNLDSLAMQNEDRMRRLQEMSTVVSHSDDPDEILQTFISHQPPLARNPSRHSIRTETTFRPTSTGTFG